MIMRRLLQTATVAGLVMAASGNARPPRAVFLPLTLDDEEVTSPALRPPQVRPRIDILFDAPAYSVPAAPLSEADIAALVRDGTVAATLPPQPLGQFAETVLGQVLQVPYILGPGVAQRRDLVSMSGPQAMSSQQFLRLAEKALNQYGLALSFQAGAIVVREAPLPRPNSQDRSGPGIASDKSSPTLVHVAALGTLSAGPAAGLVTDIVESGGTLGIEQAPDVNGIILSGDETAVNDARGLIDGIDRPEYVGMRVAKITPVLWDSEKLAGMLRDVLASEGFQIGMAGSGGTSLLHLPRPDCLLLFSDDVRLFDRVLYWVKQLDSLEGVGGDRAGFFVYQVRNTTAAELGALVSRANSAGELTLAGPVMARMDEASGQLGRSRGAGGSGIPSSSSSATDGDSSGQIVVDTPGNRILFRGTRRDFAQVENLLRQLDVAAKQVLVEITIAEVALTDETRFGMEWFFDRQLTNGSLQGSSLGGSQREPGGVGLTFAKSFAQTSVTAALNAIATNQNLNILSTPRLLARSGGQAQILIGNDVPIITSQRAADIQSSGDTDILQTVQYRQTGVILNIKPVVLSDDRIDIEIFQEVSSQQPNMTSAIGSPVISNRSVTTRLSLREGMTAVLGGMIQDSQSMGQRGIPFIKDIPLLGRAFRTDSTSKRKTELLIMVTPRVIKEDKAMRDVTAAFSKSMNTLMNGRGQSTFTLLPWAPGSTIAKHNHFEKLN